MDSFNTINGKAPLRESENHLEDPNVKRKKVIFFTSSEYGQANVVLAVAYELLLHQKHEVHIASFAPLKARVQDLNTLLPKNTSPAIFHTIAGPSTTQILKEKEGFLRPFPPTIKGALQSYRVTLPALATAWDISQYMVGYESCLEILTSVDADLIVIESLMDQGLEACRKLERKCVVLSPNTYQEILRKQQPLFTRYCTLPAISSGFPYPVPNARILANVYLNFQMIFSLIRSSKVRKLIRDRKERGFSPLPPSYNIWSAKNHYLLPSTPESEYPFHIPSNVTPCGPILLPATPLSTADPSLHSWLAHGPTIMINLGSIVRMDIPMTLEFATGLKTVLAQNPDLQILWKIKKSGGLTISLPEKRKRELRVEESEEDALAPIADEIANGRVRILEWLAVDPLSVLESGGIVCAVHHGGSNSFHEALSVGIPQVILPCWFDTLDFAHRVEWLGIGVYGSRKAAPSVESGELARALLRVLGDGPEAVGMREKARDLATITGRYGGRKKACDKIVELLGNF